MNPRLLLATVRRVLAQLRHDPRTVGLLVAVPSLLMVLLRYVFDSAAFFDNIAPALLGFFPFLMMFLIASLRPPSRRYRREPPSPMKGGNLIEP
jgi:ABC-2 type transport system permease protein